ARRRARRRRAQRRCPLLPRLSKRARIGRPAGGRLDPRRTERGDHMSTDADRTADAGLRERVAAALEVAEIPPSKLGQARRSRLGDSERAVYVWILRGFAERGRPTGEELGREAEQLGLALEPALATLRGEDLVHARGDGEITVAYPFSGVPTAHRVRFPNGQEAFAMCAIDALG